MSREVISKKITVSVPQITVEFSGDKDHPSLTLRADTGVLYRLQFHGYFREDNADKHGQEFPKAFGSSLTVGLHKEDERVVLAKKGLWSYGITFWKR